MMAEFNSNLYKVKGIYTLDETDVIITGFYYQDEHDRHFIVDEKDFKHYETNPYALCRNTGIENNGNFLYEYDVVSYCEPMKDKKQYGVVDFDEFQKCYIVRTGIEQRGARLLKDCVRIENTGKNIVLNDDDLMWFSEWEKTQWEESKSYVVDNSYCPSCFKR